MCHWCIASGPNSIELIVNEKIKRKSISFLKIQKIFKLSKIVKNTQLFIYLILDTLQSSACPKVLLYT